MTTRSTGRETPAAPPATEVEQQADQLLQEQAKRRRRRNTTILICSGIAVVIVAVIAIVAIIMALGSTGETQTAAPAASTSPQSAVAAAPAAAPASPTGGSGSPAENPAVPIAAAPSAVNATFTPGTYTLEQATQFSIAECQSDAAKVVACFVTFLGQGDVKRARAISTFTTLDLPSISAQVKKEWQAWETKGTKFLGVRVYNLERYIGKETTEPAKEGPFIPGEYLATFDYLFDAGVVRLTDVKGHKAHPLLQEDGKWLLKLE